MKVLFTICLAFFTLSLFSQNLTIDTSYTIEELVMDFFDNDQITVSNISHTGAELSVGFFDSTNDSLGVHAGVVISSGNVLELPQPAIEFISGSFGEEGDQDIEDIANFQGSNDASIIEFDFTVTEDTDLDFSYVFGSEEYPEFVNSAFNDAFAFLISGPNYSGPYSNNSENISTLPGTTDPVAINSVNDGMNVNYYVNNELSQDVVLDGITTILPASFTAIANETYHIKIVTADIADSAFDSAVFLGYNSLGNPDSLVPPTEATFAVQGNQVIINNESKYATSYAWDFGNNTYSTERYPGPVFYENEGTYTISLTTQNYCCTNTYTAEVQIEMAALSAEIEVVEFIQCYGDATASVSLDIQGGNAPYEYSVTPNTDLFNMAAGLYTFVITDADGNSITEEINITEPAEIIVSTEKTDSDLDENNGTAMVTATGGTEPLEIEWSNGETTAEIKNLAPGEYTVTITDANNCVMEETVNIFVITSILEDELISLQVSPNPVNDLAVISVPASYEIGEIKVFNSLGQIVYPNIELRHFTVQMNTTDLATGIYFISIQIDENEIPLWGKFVKE